jgi:acyl-CoA dehydrogenase
MRWLGQAARCHAIAVEHAGKRHSFGKTLIEHQGVGFMLADNEIDLHKCRLAIWHAAWVLDQHDFARNETSMVKVLCSEVLGQVVVSPRIRSWNGSIGISGHSASMTGHRKSTVTRSPSGSRRAAHSTCCGASRTRTEHGV